MTWQILWTKVKKFQNPLSPLIVVQRKQRKIRRVLLLMLAWVHRARVSSKTIQMKISRKYNTITEGVTLKRVLSVTVLNVTSIRVLNVILTTRVRVSWLIQISMHSNSCHEIKQGRSSKKLILVAANNKILRLACWINKSRILNTMEYSSISKVKDSVAQYKSTSSSHSNQCLFKISPISQVTPLKICMEITWDKAGTTHRWAKKIWT